MMTDQIASAHAAEPTSGGAKLLWSFHPSGLRSGPPVEVPGFAAPVGLETRLVTRAFDRRACDAVLELGQQMPLGPGLVVNGSAYDRNSRLAWLEPNDSTTWIYRRVEAIFETANAWYGFDLDGIDECLQFARYDVGSHFNWHVDSMRVKSRVRKLSLSIQLSDPGDYTGGALEFIREGGEPYGARHRGTAVIFPAFNLHRVTPVQSGARFALIAWAVGPMFR